MVWFHHYSPIASTWTFSILHKMEGAHQPRSFDFPKRQFGKKNVVLRSFQCGWFDTWPWLHYDEGSDSVFYHNICLQAATRQKAQMSAVASKMDKAFVSVGYTLTGRMLHHLSGNINPAFLIELLLSLLLHCHLKYLMWVTCFRRSTKMSRIIIMLCF